MNTASIAALPSALVDRLEGVERTVELRLEDLGRTAAALTDRLHGLEKTFSGSMTENARHWTVVGDRMKSLDSVIAGSDTGSMSALLTDQLVAVTDRLQGLEQAMQTRQSETQRVWSTIGDRLKSLDDGIGAQRQELQRATAGQLQGGGAMQSFVTDRFQTLTLAMQRQKDELTASVFEPMTQRMQQVEAVSTQAMRSIVERLAQLEIVARSQAEHTTAVQQAHERDLSDIHSSVMKLAENQVTLSDNLDHWRQEGDGSLGVIKESLDRIVQTNAKPSQQFAQLQGEVASRLAMIEETVARPNELLVQMQTDLQGLQQVTLADYDKNRRGWKSWLFGTDEVFAHSWRDETEQVRQRLRQMRESRSMKA